MFPIFNFPLFKVFFKTPNCCSFKCFAKSIETISDFTIEFFLQTLQKISRVTAFQSIFLIFIFLLSTFAQQ
jgi:hypothetical protein